MPVYGAVVWLGCVVLAFSGRSPFWVLELLFLLAPLVLVPLALLRISSGEALPPSWRLQPLAASSAAASFLVPRGLVAGALAGAWLVFTLVLAWSGLARLRRRGWRVPEIAMSAGLLLVPVGGGWLVLSRLGATPLGFVEPIVLLTAVHFHYTAFLTPVLVGLAGRVLGDRGLYRWIVAGVLGGTPLVAAGITFMPALELVGASILALSLWAFAMLSLVRLRPRLPRGIPRALLVTSSLALIPSMALAVAYAWGQATGHAMVSLSTVARLHGPLNAFGFALCGLLGWTTAARRRAS